MQCSYGCPLNHPCRLKVTRPFWRCHVAFLQFIWLSLSIFESVLWNFERFSVQTPHDSYIFCFIILQMLYVFSWCLPFRQQSAGNWPPSENCTTTESYVWCEHGCNTCLKGLRRVSTWQIKRWACFSLRLFSELWKKSYKFSSKTEHAEKLICTNRHVLRLHDFVRGSSDSPAEPKYNFFKIMIVLQP